MVKMCFFYLCLRYCIAVLRRREKREINSLQMILQSSFFFFFGLERGEDAIKAVSIAVTVNGNPALIISVSFFDFYFIC